MRKSNKQKNKKILLSLSKSALYIKEQLIMIKINIQGLKHVAWGFSPRLIKNKNLLSPEGTIDHYCCPFGAQQSRCFSWG